MTDIDAAGHLDLVQRLAQFGDALDLDETRIVDRVLERIDTVAANGRAWRRVWLVAAAIVALMAAVVLHPDSRHAVARWFGIDGVSIEIDPSLSVPATAPAFTPPGPGETRVVEVDGDEIVVSAVPGSLTDGLITKTVGSSDQIREVTVAGHPGLWVTGAPHEVMYAAPDGDVVVERVAVDTLLWHDGSVLYRVEGFEDLSAALAFAEGT